MTRKTYKIRWTNAVTTETVASVDVTATTDANAISQADKLDRQMGKTNNPRTIYEGGRLVDSR